VLRISLCWHLRGLLDFLHLCECKLYCPSRSHISHNRIYVQINLLQILCQFLGGLLTALFVLDGWHYNAFWVLFAFFSFVPALAEISVLIGVFGLKVIKY